MRFLWVGHSESWDLAIRFALGSTFIAHGAQKLFGWWGGYGLEATGQWMASIGLTPGLLMALAAGGIEFFGGIAMLIGLMTRPVAILASVVMLVALFSVHLANGFFISNNGYEFALSLLAMSLSLSVAGSGRFSADALIREG